MNNILTLGDQAYISRNSHHSTLENTPSTKTPSKKTISKKRKLKDQEEIGGSWFEGSVFGVWYRSRKKSNMFYVWYRWKQYALPPPLTTLPFPIYPFSISMAHLSLSSGLNFQGRNCFSIFPNITFHSCGALLSSMMRPPGVQEWSQAGWYLQDILPRRHCRLYRHAVLQPWYNRSAMFFHRQQTNRSCQYFSNFFSTVAVLIMIFSRLNNLPVLLAGQAAEQRPYSVQL